jgi:hypothetical protein
LRPQGDALMIRYMAAVPLLLAAMSAQNVPSTNKGRHLDIPAISRKANGSIVSIVMSNKDGHPIAQGSGFLISKDGHVVTNYHVIKSGTSAVVKLPDGAFFPVDGVLTSDKGRDVAIIKAHGNDFHTLTLGDSDRLQVGEEVVAIGNPLSLESTVSNGIVSAIRTVEDEGGKFVQITAPISPGSSGGPLFNMAGEVVGITTSRIKGGENLNFAIPINDVKLMLRARVSTASALPDEVDESDEASPKIILYEPNGPTGFTEAFSTEPACSGLTLKHKWGKGEERHWMLELPLFNELDDTYYRETGRKFLSWDLVEVRNWSEDGHGTFGPHFYINKLLDDDFQAPKSADCISCTFPNASAVRAGAKAVCTIVKGGGKAGAGKVD